MPTICRLYCRLNDRIVPTVACGAGNLNDSYLEAVNQISSEIGSKVPFPAIALIDLSGLVSW
jgi:hypothetical protein